MRGSWSWSLADGPSWKQRFDLARELNYESMRVELGDFHSSCETKQHKLMSCSHNGKRMIKASIWTKLTVFIGILVILTSGVLALVLWLKARQQLSLEIERRLVAVAILRKDGIDDYFSGEIDKMVLISSRIQIINYLSHARGVPHSTAVYDLQSALSAISEVTSAAIYNSSGALDIVIGDGDFPQFPPQMHNGSRPIDISTPRFSKNRWEYIMFRSIMTNDQREVGVLAAWINATSLARLIYDRTGLENTGELLVVVAKTDDSNVVQLVMPPHFNKSLKTIPRKGAVQAAMEGKVGIAKERDYRGTKVIVAYTPINYVRWGLLAKVDKSEAYAPVGNIKLVMIIMIIITLILGIIASLCVAKIFTSPIIELGKVAAAIGLGDLSARVRIKSVWLRDEIYELQTIFNSMANQIQDHHATLEQKVQERTWALTHANNDLASEVEVRKRIEAELHNAKDAAVAADKAKSEFLANMSHEIRTPLNGIINCTELCLDTQTSAEQQEYLELVKFSAKHLLRIITDILDFSKIEAGKLAMEEIHFSLYDQLEHAVSVLAARAHKKRLDIISKVDFDVPDELIGDPGRLFQIFVNLIGNSIKFTEQGEVVLSAEVSKLEQDKVELLFSVQDTGPGIPKDKQSLLFQAFSQVDSSTTRLHGGTGLGLVISSKLAAAMKGKMWMESEGRGSTFWFTACFDLPPGRVPLKSLQVNRLKDVSVLVADRSGASLQVLVNQLEAWGMKTEARTNAKEAKDSLQRAANSGQPFRVLLIYLWLDGTAELVNYVKQRPGLVGTAGSVQNRRFRKLRRDTDDHAMYFSGYEEEEFELDLASVQKRNQTVEQRLPPSTEVNNAKRHSIVMLTSIDHSDVARCKELGVDLHTSKPIKRECLRQALEAAIGIDQEEETTVQSRKGNTSTESSKETFAGLHVLVAEDNIVNQRVAVSLLQKWGHTVVLACNGAEAVDRSSKEAFDLILMDVQMPICDGFEATRKIRELEEQRTTPIVAITAHAMFGDGDRCIAAGMDGYISKPISAKKLQELLHSIPMKRRNGEA